MNASLERVVVALAMFAAPVPQEDPNLGGRANVVCETTPQAEWSSFCWEWALKEAAPAAFAAWEAAAVAAGAASDALRERAPAAFDAHRATEQAWLAAEQRIAAALPEWWRRYRLSQEALAEARRKLERTREWGIYKAREKAVMDGDATAADVVLILDAMEAAHPTLFAVWDTAPRTISEAEDAFQREAPGLFDAWRTSWETMETAKEALRLTTGRTFDAERRAAEAHVSAFVTLRLSAPSEFDAWRNALDLEGSRAR